MSINVRQGKKDTKNFKAVGRIAAAALITIAAAGTAAAAGAAIGLYKWAKSEKYHGINIFFGYRCFSIRKTDDPSRFEIDTDYDWKSDPDFRKYLDE